MPENTSATGGILRPAEPVASDDAFVDLLGDFTATLTGLDRDNHVRPRVQKEAPPRPKNDVNWCAVGPISQIPDDNVYKKQDNDASQLIQRHERVEVVASFYGPSAAAYAGIMRDGLNISQNRATLRDNGLGVVSVDGPVQAAEPVKNEFLERHDVRIVFNREIVRTYRVLTLQSAEGSIEAKASRNEVLTVPFIVDKGV